MKVQDLVTIVPWTFVAQILNLFLQAFLIKKFLFKPIREILDKRRAMADAQISDAEKAKAEALAMKEEYEQDMSQAKARANDIVSNAQKTAAAMSDDVIREANRQASAIKAKAESDIAQERKKAVNEIKDEIGSLAMDIAGKVIEREISEEDHRRLIDEYIENVGETS